MEKQINHKCDQHSDPFECADNLIFYSTRFDEYGIIIHDGGASFSRISYCPWCGTKLPNSKRDLWFDILEEMGFDSPFEQDIPDEYNSDKWYRDKSVVKPDKTNIREYIESCIQKIANKYRMVEPPSFIIDNSVDNMTVDVTELGKFYKGTIKLCPSSQDYHYDEVIGSTLINYSFDGSKTFRIDF